MDWIRECRAPFSVLVKMVEPVLDSRIAPSKYSRFGLVTNPPPFHSSIMAVWRAWHLSPFRSVVRSDSVLYAQVSKETLESITTPDKGKGGKYLVLPPGYQGDVPDGYFVVRSNTYTIMFFMRASIAKGHGKQLAADHPGKELVRHPPHVGPRQSHPGGPVRSSCGDQ